MAPAEVLGASLHLLGERYALLELRFPNESPPKIRGTFLISSGKSDALCQKEREWIQVLK